MADKKELNVEEMEKVNGGNEIIHLPVTHLPGDESKINPLIKSALTKPKVEPVKVVQPAEPTPPASGVDTFNQGKNENLKSLQQNSIKGTNTQNNITIN